MAHFIIFTLFLTDSLNPPEGALGLTDPDYLFLHKKIYSKFRINSEHSVADSFKLYFNFDQKQ